MNATRRHIVVIDDDLSFLEVMCLVLEEEGGYHVTTSALAFDDMAEVERLQPDLIMLDVLMPGQQSVWTFIHKLKQHPPTKDIPLLLCTALTHMSEQASTFTQTGIPILYKPFDMEELLQIIEDMFS